MVRLSVDLLSSPLSAHSPLALPPRRITNGIYSDYFTTAVRTSGEAGDTNGISFLLIPKTEGVTCKRMLMSGQWCAGTTFVTFEDVKVPVENLIGKEGAGFKMIMTNVSAQFSAKSRSLTFCALALERY